MDSSIRFDEFLRKFEDNEARWEERLSRYREWRAATVESRVAILERTPAAKLDAVLVADNWGGLFVDATDDPIPSFDYFPVASDSVPVERAFEQKEQHIVVAHVVADDWGGLFNGVHDEPVSALDSFRDAFASNDSDDFPVDAVVIEYTSTDASSAIEEMEPVESPPQIQELEKPPPRTLVPIALDTACDIPADVDYSIESLGILGSQIQSSDKLLVAPPSGSPGEATATVKFFVEREKEQIESRPFILVQIRDSELEAEPVQSPVSVAFSTKSVEPEFVPAFDKELEILNRLVGNLSVPQRAPPRLRPRQGPRLRCPRRAPPRPLRLPQSCRAPARRRGRPPRLLDRVPGGRLRHRARARASQPRARFRCGPTSSAAGRSCRSSSSSSLCSSAVHLRRQHHRTAHARDGRVRVCVQVPQGAEELAERHHEGQQRRRLVYSDPCLVRVRDTCSIALQELASRHQPAGVTIAEKGQLALQEGEHAGFLVTHVKQERHITVVRAEIRCVRLVCFRADADGAAEGGQPSLDGFYILGVLSYTHVANVVVIAGGTASLHNSYCDMDEDRSGLHFRLGPVEHAFHATTLGGYDASLDDGPTSCFANPDEPRVGQAFASAAALRPDAVGAAGGGNLAWVAAVGSAPIFAHGYIYGVGHSYPFVIALGAHLCFEHGVPAAAFLPKLRGEFHCTAHLRPHQEPPDAVVCRALCVRDDVLLIASKAVEHDTFWVNLALMDPNLSFLGIPMLIRSLVASCGTNIAPGFKISAVLLSDGHNVQLHTFSFSSDHDTATMHAISEFSDGKFPFIDADGSMQAGFAQRTDSFLSIVVKEIQLGNEYVDNGVLLSSIKSEEDSGFLVTPCFSLVAVQYRPPWPPPIQLEMLSDGFQYESSLQGWNDCIQLQPWPSCTLANRCSMSQAVCWMPP